MFRRRFTQSGFLMIEVIIATLIVSIALVAAAGMFIQSSKVNADADQYTVAAGLAQMQLELLKQWTPGDWSSNISSFPANIEWQGTENNPVLIDHITYTVSTVAEVCPEDSVNLIQARVTVAWVNKSLTMTAYYSKTKLF